MSPQSKADTPIALTQSNRANQIRMNDPIFDMLLGSSIFIIADLDGNIRSASIGIHDMLGWYPDEVEKKPVTILIPPHFQPLHQKGFDNFKKTEILVHPHVQAMAMHRDGHEVPVRIKFRAFTTVTGQQRVIALIEDVTRLRLIEEEAEAFRRSEQQLREVIDALPCIIWTANPDGTRDFFSAYFYSFTGLRLQDIPNEGWRSHIYGDDQDRTRSAWLHAVHTSEPYEIQHRWVSRDGQARWFLTRALPLRASDGTVIKWVGSATDIHDQKVREILQMRMAPYISLKDQGVIGLATDGTILSWDKNAQTIYGWTPEEAIGRNISIVALDALHDEQQGFLEQLRRGEHVYAYRATRIRRDGEVIQVRFSLAPVFDAAGEMIASIAITERIGSHHDDQ